MRLPHRLQGQKVKSQGGTGAYCGSHLAAQLVCDKLILNFRMLTDFSIAFTIALKRRTAEKKGIKSTTPPGLESVAALPCEISVFNRTVRC